MTALDKLCAPLDALRPQCFDDLWSVESELVTSAPDLLRDHVNYELERLGADARYLPSISPLRETAFWSASLLMIEAAAARTVISDSPCHQLIIPVRPGNVGVRIYEQRNEHAHDELDRRLQLTETDTVMLRDVSSIRIVAGRTVLDPVGDDNDSALILVVRGELQHWLTWQYDRATLTPVAALASTLQATRMDFALNTLVELRSVGSADAVAGILEHPAHYLRWSAARALNVLAPERTPVVLEKLKDDSNRHVRRAARKALGIEVG